MKVLINGIRLFDHMMVGSYLRCWNYYFFKYVLGLSEPEFPEALVMGIIFHSALAKWYETGSVEETEKEFLAECDKYDYYNKSDNALKVGHPRSVDNALEKLRIYCNVYSDDYFLATGNEVEHFLKMEALRRHSNVARGKNGSNRTTFVHGQPVWYVGHIDCVGEINNEVCFLEHKTTTLYEQSPLLEAYTFGLQVKGYTMCIMDLYKLKESCQGYIDLIYLRAKTKANTTLRYPIRFDNDQMSSFRENLSFMMGEIINSERMLKEWSLPDPCKCTAFNRICEYKEACDLLPNVKVCESFLKRKGFVPTMPARLDKIEKEGNDKEPGKLYYRVEEGATL